MHTIKNYFVNQLSNRAVESAGTLPTVAPTQPNYDKSRHMNAVCFNGIKNMEVQSKPMPLVSHPRDVLLKVTATSICGSDLHMYTGAAPTMQKGDIVGHEFMGLIEDIGTEVKNFKRGDRIVVAFNIVCGECEYCKRQEYTACACTNPCKLQKEMFGHRTAALYGYTHLFGGVPGGQAEYVRVPLADYNCLLLPDSIPDEKALYLSDVVPTSYHGAELADVKLGNSVGIWGLGPVGLLTARWCQIRKARRIIGIDSVRERLDVARKLGIEVIDFSQQSVVEAIEKLEPEGLDCSIECAGYEYTKTNTHYFERAVGLETDSSEILTEMFICTRKFGRVAVIGVYVGFSNHFPIGILMEKGLTVTGSQSPTQKYWKICMEKIMSGEFDPTFVVTHRGTLADAPSFYKTFHKKQDGFIKCFLRPNTLAAKTSTTAAEVSDNTAPVIAPAATTTTTTTSSANK